MQTNFNDLTEVEKHIYNEYKSWAKVAKQDNGLTFNYALSQVEYFSKIMQTNNNLKRFL